MASLPAAPLATPRLDRVRVALVVCVAFLAGLVAVIAYLVSFEAISAYVATIGAIPTWLRWCGPLLIDTFITIATAFLLWLALSGAELRKEPDAWFAWLLIAAATLASAYLNAADAPDRWDAAWSPEASPSPCSPASTCWCGSWSACSPSTPAPAAPPRPPTRRHHSPAPPQG